MASFLRLGHLELGQELGLGRLELVGLDGYLRILGLRGQCRLEACPYHR